MGFPLRPILTAGGATSPRRRSTSLLKGLWIAQQREAAADGERVAIDVDHVAASNKWLPEYALDPDACLLGEREKSSRKAG